MSQEKQILPSTVTPVHYVLQFTPDFKKFTFFGEAVIELKVKAPTKEIKVNAVELDFVHESIKLEVKKNTFIQLQGMNYNEDRQEMTFTFKEAIPEGNATLHLSFTGVHNDKMAGFYRSSYANLDGELKYMVVTQFEATDARRAFPCWDEPSLKATFDVILHVSKEMTALSNMNEVESKAHATLPNYKTIRFARTPVMSTYLVAFAVGEFDFIEKHTKISNQLIPVRVYTTKGLVQQGEFALDCACKFLSFFSKKFVMPYVLPKMDMLAVPDFSAGAMENWGLVTYRTVMLLVDKNNTSSMTQQRVAYVVAHELAHQWFGNIVTMKWWDELWLNEGFATWVGWYAVDHYFPSWQVWSQFVNNELGKALELDALQSSHPIQVPVFRPSEISQIFDSISYSKGASVIRMLSNWLGVDRFIQGVASYLQKHQYKNAATEDLWDALNESTGENVREFMSLWTKQVGYPVLHITLSPSISALSASSGTCKLHVKQERFLTGSYDQQALNAEEMDQKPWWCPLGMKQLPGSMVTSKEQTFDIPMPQSNPLDTLLNLDQSNFYRAHYPNDLLKVFQQFNHQLHEVDRAGLISDAFALCIQGDYSTLVPLQFVLAEAQLPLKRLKGEPVPNTTSSSSPFSYIALSQVDAGISKLKEVWALEPTLPNLKELMRQVFSPVAKQLGWQFTSQDDHLHGLLRTLAISAAGSNEDQSVVQQALQYVSEDVLLRQVHPNVRGAVYSMAVKHGGMEAFTSIRDQVYLNGQLSMDQRLSALSALGYVQSENDVLTLLNFVMEKVRPQDWVYPFRTASIHHRLFVWRYLKEHWDTLERVFQPSSLAHTVLLTSSWADTKLAETEIVAFFKNRNTALYDRALKQTLEKIKMQEAWLNKDRHAVASWLAENCGAN